MPDIAELLEVHKKSREAALVKRADKICNLRDIASRPPADWPLDRRREYFDFAKRVVDGLPEISGPLREAFDQVFAARPYEGRR